MSLFRLGCLALFAVLWAYTCTIVFITRTRHIFTTVLAHKMDSSEDTVTSVITVDGEPFRLRSYQAEMVEESLHANVIVVMDTGSGKTHV